MPAHLLTIIIYTLAAGLAIPIGALAATPSRIFRSDLGVEALHGITAFGGGVLIAAIALVLVPDGAEKLPAWGACLAFVVGALLVYVLDMRIEKRGGKAGQVFALLLDFIPEAVALGAMFAAGDGGGPLLALLIGVQNLPEGFNAFRDLRDSGMRRARAILILGSMALLGPVAGLTGFSVLADHDPAVGVIMLGAAGGILYLTFQDIAPQARMERHWAPPLGAVLGFLVGLIGHLTL